MFAASMVSSFMIHRSLTAQLFCYHFTELLNVLVAILTTKLLHGKVKPTCARVLVRGPQHNVIGELPAVATWHLLSFGHLVQLATRPSVWARFNGELGYCDG